MVHALLNYLHFNITSLIDCAPLWLTKVGPDVWHLIVHQLTKSWTVQCVWENYMQVKRLGPWNMWCVIFFYWKMCQFLLQQETEWMHGFLFFPLNTEHRVKPFTLTVMWWTCCHVTLTAMHHGAVKGVFVPLLSSQGLCQVWSNALESYIYLGKLHALFKSLSLILLQFLSSRDAEWAGKRKKRFSKSSGNRNMEENLELNFLLQYWR